MILAGAWWEMNERLNSFGMGSKEDVRVLSLRCRYALLSVGVHIDFATSIACTFQLGMGGGAVSLEELEELEELDGFGLLFCIIELRVFVVRLARRYAFCFNCFLLFFAFLMLQFL